ncbi:MAG: acyl carrier protein [Candidatus Dependentiae bacterium]|nr:acyl carrier protein [Candidatus Dependentiae bacterium]
MISVEQQETFHTIVDIIAATLHIEKGRIHVSSTLQDLGADSLAMVEIILKLEEQFGIEIDDEKAEHLTNVQEVLDYISTLKGL